jgi:hypothetical protein
LLQKTFPREREERENSGQLLFVSGFGGGPLLDAIKKKKKERNTSLALHVFCAFGSLFFHLSRRFNGRRKEERSNSNSLPQEKREKRERKVSIGEKSNNGEKDEGRQTATAAAKDD